MRILIAEDEPVSRRLLEAKLLKWGYDVVVTCDEDEAWESYTCFILLTALHLDEDLVACMESEVGKGSLFRVRLPLKVAEEMV
jgi:AmiR/NasT family two-component response regulator